MQLKINCLISENKSAPLDQRVFKDHHHDPNTDLIFQLGIQVKVIPKDRKPTITMERETPDSGRQIVHRFTCENTDSLRSPARLVRMYSSPKDADEQRKIHSMYEEIERRVAQGRALLDDENAIDRPLNYGQPLQPELILSEQKEDRRSHQLTETRTHKSLQEQLERDLFRETENPDGLRSSIKQHVIQRLTTLTPVQQVSSRYQFSTFITNSFNGQARKCPVFR